jgi:hypothetical protein
MRGDPPPSNPPTRPVQVLRHYYSCKEYNTYPIIKTYSIRSKINIILVLIIFFFVTDYLYNLQVRPHNPQACDTGKSG